MYDDPCCFPDLLWLAYLRCLDAMGFKMPILICGVPFMLIIPAGYPLTKWYGFLGCLLTLDLFGAAFVPKIPSLFYFAGVP